MPTDSADRTDYVSTDQALVTPYDLFNRSTFCYYKNIVSFISHSPKQDEEIEKGLLCIDEIHLFIFLLSALLLRLADLHKTSNVLSC